MCLKSLCTKERDIYMLNTCEAASTMALNNRQVDLL